MHTLQELLEFAASKVERAQIPQNDVVIGAVGRQGVAVVQQRRRQRFRICLDGLGVVSECLTVGLFECHSQSTDVVVVRAALQRRKDRIVDGVLEVRAVEDDARPRAPQRLVCRGRDDIAVLEGALGFAGSHQTTDVRHVGHQVCPTRIGNSSHPTIVPVSRIRTRTGNQQAGAEDQRQPLQVVIVNEASLWVDAIGHALEVDRRGRHASLWGGVAV
mmetsp:Transcript_12587/g.36550  ORF Transcript_12587/g.36550 Transcript_12587/m.36550 type:complete len:217 (-) Transcript_12587:729-1379(-)